MAHKFKAIFVLGGPGSGKGTQCQLIQKAYQFVHLSAGHLLRQERARPHSQFGETIQKFIIDGKIVPSHITISLLLAAMRNHHSKTNHFLIDGFPRNLQNLNSWKEMTNKEVECPFLLHLVCTEQEMTKRLMIRSTSSNRSDDNAAVISKRFATYHSQTMQVIRQFQKQGKVKHVEGHGNVHHIFQQVKPIFQEYCKRQKLI